MTFDKSAENLNTSVRFRYIFVSHLKCALSVQAHLRHGYQHLLVDELCVSLRLHLLTLRYQLEGRRDGGGCWSIHFHFVIVSHTGTAAGRR